MAYKMEIEYRRLIYVAHPYSGDEQGNIKKAQEIVKELQLKHPHNTYISPLLTFGYLGGNVSYEQAMKLCASLLDRCDMILLTGDWRKSKGCLIELEYARLNNIPIMADN